MPSFFDKFKAGLTKTREDLAGKMNEVLGLAMTVDEELYEELEEVLISSDVGYETSMEIIERLRRKIRIQRITDVAEVRGALKEVIAEFMEEGAKELVVERPTVILIIGVNGVGKTTSIGKLAHRFKSEGKTVLVAAGDTFRAAAIDQLDVWAGRAGVDIVKHLEGADPAAVVYDALQALKARGTDVLLVDTAGRLHNKKNLMNELEKIKRVIDRECPEALRYSLLVLDGTTGQNAIVQAREFKKVTDLDGLILTKLDGTAKGGVVLSVKQELGVPVLYVGLGEGMDDMEKFSPAAFSEFII